MDKLVDACGQPVQHPYIWSGKPLPGDSLLETAAGQRLQLSEERIDLDPNQVGQWIQYAGYRLHVPASASLHWPALPYNPYRKGGQAAIYEGRIEVRAPFDEQNREHRLRLEVLE